jgi:hypothetical protein
VARDQLLVDGSHFVVARQLAELVGLVPSAQLTRRRISGSRDSLKRAISSS